MPRFGRTDAQAPPGVCGDCPIRVSVSKPGELNFTSSTLLVSLLNDYGHHDWSPNIAGTKRPDYHALRMQVTCSRPLIGAYRGPRHFSWIQHADKDTHPPGNTAGRKKLQEDSHILLSVACSGACRWVVRKTISRLSERLPKPP